MLLCFLISCEKKDSNFSEEMIEKLAIHDDDEKDGIMTINNYSFINVYIKTNEDEIFVTNGEFLYQSYKLYYQKKYKTFKEFLEVILDKDYVFDASNEKIILLQNFKLNSKIYKEFNSLGLEKFLKKYSKASSTKGIIELNNSIIETDEYSTIQYLLYLNRYDISFDDPHVRYSVIKREDYFK